MRGAAVLLLLVLPGCLTRALWSGHGAAPPPPKVRGELECALALAAPAEGSTRLAFAVAPPAHPPKRMEIELSRGRTCLLLREPFSLSFAGTEILDGRTAFPPERVTVHFAQTRTKKGTRRDPALLRVEGTLPDTFSARVEPCEAPQMRHSLEEVRDEDLRVQLGHGIDTLLSTRVDPRPGDAVAWCGVEGPGDWREALDLAWARASLAPLEPYRVIARLWRDGKATCYRMPLSDVILASHMALAGSDYTWEGLYVCSLELPQKAAAPARTIPARLRYTELKEQPKDPDLAWRVALTPLALAGDYGIARIDSWLDAEDDDGCR
jgi:hypothetical protein